MEKNIASHDLSDMMVYEGMRTQSRKFHFKQSFEPFKKIIEKIYLALELIGKFAKQLVRPSQRSFEPKHIDFSNTATAVYSITLASIVISFFWLTLLTTI